MTNFWLMILLVCCILLDDSCSQKFKFSPEKLLEPPVHTVYDDYKDQCGVANYCESPDSVGCVPGEKRRKRDTFQGEDYIKDGKSVPKFKYPWMVALATKERGKRRFSFFFTTIHDAFCSGTLISMRHVLTARNCLLSDESGTGLDYKEAWGVRVAPKVPDRLYALLGADRTTDGVTFDFKAEQRVLHIMIPPKLNLEEDPFHDIPFTLTDHDFALLEIEDVIFSDFIRPICLPIDGIPLGGHYVQAGFGKKSEHGGKQDHADALQEIDDIYLDPVHGNPNEKLFYGGAENLKEHIVNPKDGTPAYNGTGVTHLFYYYDKRTGCDGDSGGPVMWRNPNTEKYFIVGVYQGHYGNGCSNSNKINARSFANKVTYFMEYIYQEMKPNTYVNKMCLAPDCKYGNTTWTQNEGSNRYLAPPCGKPKIVNRVFCLHSNEDTVLVDRTRSNGQGIDFYKSHGFSECVPCPANTDVNWNYNYWLEQITLGSFSQPRYFGVQSPYEMLKKDFKGILSNQPTDDCVDYEYRGVRCLGDTGKSVCISSDVLCDGFRNCPNAWDENPSVCVGKCDYWTEHQESSYYWKGRAIDSIKNVEQCQQFCKNSISCKVYQYDSSSGTCATFDEDETSLHNQFDDSKTFIRGPGKCPGAQQDSDLRCKKILTPPYRNGAFRIQSFSGRYLQVNAFEPVNLDVLIWLSAEKPTLKMPEATKNEWLVQFHGSNELDESFSTIRSGVIKPRAGVYEEEMYITIRYPDASSNDEAYVSMNSKLNNEFHDPGRRMDQRLYIRPIYNSFGQVEPQHLMDVAIYSKYKDPVSKTERLVRLFSYPDAEYNHNGTGTAPEKIQLLGGGPIRYRAALYRNAYDQNEKEGRFRFIECDYLDPGAHGITEKLPQKYKKNPTFFQDCMKKTFSVPDLYWDFGISYTRLQKTVKSDTLKALKKSICSAFKEAHTIWDFAGRIRLTTDGFRRLYLNFEKIIAGKKRINKPTLEVLDQVKNYFLQNIPEYLK